MVRTDFKTFYVRSGQSVSEPVDLRYGDGCLLFVPTLDATSAALEFQVSDSFGGTFVDLKDSAGTNVRLTVVPGSAVGLPIDAEEAAYLKVRVVTSAFAAVPQTADRLFGVTVKG